VAVACVKWGSKYGSAYVNRLARAVAAHLASPPHEFICFTDDAAGIDARRVRTEPLPSEARRLRGWWQKASLFSPQAAQVFAGRRVLYLDLDTVIVGGIGEAVALCSSAFATLSARGMANERRTCGYNSSVMAWQSPPPPPRAADRRGELEGIYTFLVGAAGAVATVTRKFDHWLEMCVEGAVLLQDALPCGYIAEYRSMLPGDSAPCGARIVTFPLQPKPHECGGWVRDAWTRHD
ncbi:hypothetical protein JKP88DRAFT_154041, partial [Tribonema minus]